MEPKFVVGDKVKLKGHDLIFYVTSVSAAGLGWVEIELTVDEDDLEYVETTS